MMRNRQNEGTAPQESLESVQNHLKRVYRKLGVPPGDAHQYAYGVAPQGA